MAAIGPSVRNFDLLAVSGQMGPGPTFIARSNWAVGAYNILKFGEARATRSATGPKGRFLHILKNVHQFLGAAEGPLYGLRATV